MNLQPPRDEPALKQEVVGYLKSFDVDVEPFERSLGVRYVPGDSAPEASAIVRLSGGDDAALAAFEQAMDSVGANVSIFDDVRTFRLENWPARVVSTLTAWEFIFVAGPLVDGSIFAEFFSDEDEMPADIMQQYPGGRLFRVIDGVPS